MIKVDKEGNEYSIRLAEHMVHLGNLENILLNGLLSYNKARELGLLKEDISMQEVQNIRHTKEITVNGKPVIVDGNQLSLHDLVSLYFNSRNPMLYKRKELRNEIVILVVSIHIIENKFFLFTDGNAGSSSTMFYNSQKDLEKLDIGLIQGSSWNDSDEYIKREKKRKMCSELLIYPNIEVNKIKGIVCYSEDTKEKVMAVINDIAPIGSHIAVKVANGWFF